MGRRQDEINLRISNENYKHEIELILKKIVKYLQQKGDLLLVILIGSRATDTATVRSDIDIITIYKGLSTNTILFPPDNIPIGVDILAFSEDSFKVGLTEGKGLFIEAMTQGRILFDEPQVIHKYQDFEKQTVNQLKMVRTEIGWKKNVY